MKIIVIIAVIVMVILAAALFLYTAPPRTASVRLFCWPSAQVNVDGSLAIEAPAPREIALSAGRHTFVFEPRLGGPTMEVNVKLKGGKRYVLRADLEEQTYTLED